MKADLWRYCIIYKYGGIYADSDSVCLKDPSLFLQKRSYLVCIPENDKMHMCNWVFASPEGSPILKSVIDLSVERILNNFEKKQHMVHYYTGPKVFIDGIESYLKENNLITFNDKSLYSFAYKNYWLHVFENLNNFNNNIVKHLESGKDENGWKSQIKEYINSK
jgi:mannosyltransferase OCH1-like enzyme